ncbi:MAG: hypothetical protein H6Q04_937 [Acidobacteria bacterium]|nr:hypothetical protein [Acidobacteriota bacterium]
MNSTRGYNQQVWIYFPNEGLVDLFAQPDFYPKLDNLVLEVTNPFAICAAFCEIIETN